MECQMNPDHVIFEGKTLDHYVYLITVDLDRPTRYVLKQPWEDKKLSMKVVMGEMEFKDSEGREVLVFEEDEDGFIEWQPPYS